jgi:hypothetical protein
MMELHSKRQDTELAAECHRSMLRTDKRNTPVRGTSCGGKSGRHGHLR